MEKSQWLYRIQPTRPGMLSEGPTEQEGRIVDEHFEYLKKLTGKGVVLHAGRTLNTDKSSFGIVIYLVENEKEARRIFEEDPAVRAGVFKGEFYPYRVALERAQIVVSTVPNKNYSPPYLPICVPLRSSRRLRQSGRGHFPSWP